MFKKLIFVSGAIFAFVSIALAVNKDSGSSDFIKIAESELSFSPSNAGRGELISVFSAINSDIYLKDISAAFDIYEGAWNGVQQVYIYGGADRPIADATVMQRYVRADYAGVKRLLGTGMVSSGGRTIDVRSIMTLVGNELILEVRDDKGARAIYRGAVKYNLVTWAPYYLFFLADSQIDGFYKIKNGISMDSTGLKYVEIPQRKFRGFFYMRSALTQIRDNYSSSEIDQKRDMKFDGKFK